MYIRIYIILSLISILIILFGNKISDLLERHEHDNIPGHQSAAVCDKSTIEGKGSLYHFYTRVLKIFAYFVLKSLHHTINGVFITITTALQ